MVIGGCRVECTHVLSVKLKSPKSSEVFCRFPDVTGCTYRTDLVLEMTDPRNTQRAVLWYPPSYNIRVEEVAIPEFVNPLLYQR